MISIVVLAAGESTRFDGNKLLERVDGSTLIEKVVRSALSSMADEVVVVLGYLHMKSGTASFLGKTIEEFIERNPRLFQKH